MIKFLSLLLAAFLSLHVHAYDLGDVGKDLASPWTDPRARWVLIAGGAATLTLLLLEDKTDPTQREIADDKPLGRLSGFADLMGQLVPNAAYLVGMLTYGGVSGSEEAKLAAGRMFRASAISTSLTLTLKQVIREERPDGSSMNSFPSGHATTAFAFAGTVLAEHGYGWGVPAFAMATLVGVGRMNDNRHYVHDVVAGATIGLVYGLGITDRDRSELKQGKAASNVVLPFYIQRIFGISYSFSFL